MVEEMGQDESLQRQAQEMGIAQQEGMGREEMMEILVQRQREAARAE